MTHPEGHFSESERSKEAIYRHDLSVAHALLSTTILNLGEDMGDKVVLHLPDDIRVDTYLAFANTDFQWDSSLDQSTTPGAHRQYIIEGKLVPFTIETPQGVFALFYPHLLKAGNIMSLALLNEDTRPLIPQEVPALIDMYGNAPNGHMLSTLQSILDIQ